MKTNKQKKEIICIECPLGCPLEITWQEKKLVVNGYNCPQGLLYAEKEAINPCRTLTSTVATAFDDFPRLPVRTAGEIPLQDMFTAMQVINSIYVNKRLSPGDILLENLLGSGIALIATADMQPQKSQYQ